MALAVYKDSALSQKCSSGGDPYGAGYVALFSDATFDAIAGSQIVRIGYIADDTVQEKHYEYARARMRYQAEIDAWKKVFSDNFTSLQAQWAKIDGAGTLSIVDDGNASDGKALQVSGGARIAYTGNTIFKRDRVYRLRVRLRQVSDPTSGSKDLSLGIAGVGANGQTLINAYGDNSYADSCWVAAARRTRQTADGYGEYVGYFRFSTTPSTDPNREGSRASPARLGGDVYYCRPVLAVNYPDGNGVVNVDFVIIEEYQLYRPKLYVAKPVESTQEDGFTGNGTQVQFTLSRKFVKPKSETVTVSGQQKTRGTDYAINYLNGVITFAAAPANGAAITVTYTHGDNGSGQVATPTIETIKQNGEQAYVALWDVPSRGGTMKAGSDGIPVVLLVETEKDVLPYEERFQMPSVRVEALGAPVSGAL